MKYSIVYNKKRKCPPPPIQSKKYKCTLYVHFLFGQNLIKDLNEKIFCNKQVFLAYLF